MSNLSRSHNFYTNQINDNFYKSRIISLRTIDRKRAQSRDGQREVRVKLDPIFDQIRQNELEKKQIQLKISTDPKQKKYMLMTNRVVSVGNSPNKKTTPLKDVTKSPIDINYFSSGKKTIRPNEKYQ